MPRVPSIRFFFARWLDQVGRSDEAVSMLRETIALSPGEPGAHDLLLRILARRERWGELETTARETLAVRSNDATARSMLQLARERLSAAPSIDALLAESVVLYRERKYEEMLRVCDAAIVRRPDSAEAWNNRCSALNALHRYAEAESACGKALQLKPDFTLARNNLAVSRAGLK
jgi:Flp pilus assembly protein TadD